MEFLRAGFRGVEDNLRIVAAFTALVVGLNLSASAVNYMIIAEMIGPLGENAKNVIDLVVDLSLVTVISAAEAITLAHIGKFLDKPLWKLKDWSDALSRFFSLWFILNLIQLVIGYGFGANAQDNPSASAALLVLLLVCNMICVPIAACLMFTGRVSFRDAGQAFAPLINLPQGTLAVLFLGFVQFAVQILCANGAIPQKAGNLSWVLGGPALYAILAITEVIVFASVWEMCRTYRDMDHDDDFDF